MGVYGETGVPNFSAEAWARATKAGQVTVGAALRGRLTRRLARGATDADMMAVLIGGITEACRIAHALTAPELRGDVETLVLSYARGALRGLAGSDDGGATL